MSWAEHHENSERLASRAQMAVRDNRPDKALELYARAADAEERAVEALDRSKTRTLGISVVSAASLHYKATQLDRAKEIALYWLRFEKLPTFAEDQLRLLLHEFHLQVTCSKRCWEVRNEFDREDSGRMHRRFADVLIRRSGCSSELPGISTRCRS